MVLIIMAGITLVYAIIQGISMAVFVSQCKSKDFSIGITAVSVAAMIMVTFIYIVLYTTLPLILVQFDGR